MKLGILSLSVAAFLAMSCQPMPGPSPSAIGEALDQPMLGIENGTALEVSVFVNGEQVGTAGAPGGMPPILFAYLPPFPWTVEARSPSGRVLTSMEVEEGSVMATAYPDGHVGTTGTFGRVDLSCGRITIWAGYSPPSGPPPASPAGSPVDCAP
jgi:hypothetical protein